MGKDNKPKKVYIYERSLGKSDIPAKENSYIDLGTTPLSRQLNLTTEQMNGHWCSRCKGIWFGYTLEAECPVCGNRHG